jgi:hypothetical protein
MVDDPSVVPKYYFVPFAPNWHGVDQVVISSLSAIYSELTYICTQQDTNYAAQQQHYHEVHPHLTSQFIDNVPVPTAPAVGDAWPNQNDIRGSTPPTRRNKRLIRGLKRTMSKYLGWEMRGHPLLEQTRTLVLTAVDSCLADLDLEAGFNNIPSQPDSSAPRGKFAPSSLMIVSDW